MDKPTDPIEFPYDAGHNDYIYSVRHQEEPAAATTPDSNDYGKRAYLKDKKDFDDSDEKNSIPLVTTNKDGTRIVVLVDGKRYPKLDMEGNAVMIPGKTPEKLCGFNFVKELGDGSLLQARVLEEINVVQKGKQLISDFRVKYDTTGLEDIMTYNKIINFLQRDQVQEKGHIWEFQRIAGHQGPLTSRHLDYKGSGYSMLVEWENGETTHEPLWMMYKDDPVTLAQYAK